MTPILMNTIVLIKLSIYMHIIYACTIQICHLLQKKYYACMEEHLVIASSSHNYMHWGRG